MNLLENPSQIILRQKHLLADDILLVCPRADGLSMQICKERPSSAVKVLSWDFHSHLNHSQYTEACFSIEPPTNWQPTQIILFMPKSRDLLPLMFAAISKVLTRVSKLWLVGEKREGIESTAKKLVTTSAKQTLPVISKKPLKLDSARHCQLWEIPVDIVSGDQPENYWRHLNWSVPKAGNINLECLPGVFSFGRLDTGTEFLLANLPHLRAANPSKQARVLDFGCGCGVIGLALHKLYPGFKIDMIDVSLLAIESAKRSAGHVSPEISVYPSSGLSAAEKGLSAIVTNPPFHQGVKQETRTTKQFLQDCATYLLKGGSLTLVANRFLPYEEWINDCVGKPEIIAENTRYKVYHALNS